MVYQFDYLLDYYFVINNFLRTNGISLQVMISGADVIHDYLMEYNFDVHIEYQNMILRNNRFDVHFEY